MRHEDNARDDRAVGVNPYQPPLAAEASSPPLAAPAALHGHPVAIVLVAIAAVAHFGFTCILLLSTPQDQMCGLLFLLNTPVLMFWIMRSWRRHRHAFLAGFAAVGVQIVIAGAMTFFGIGDLEPVWWINGLIALSFLLLALFCWRLRGVGGRPSGH